MALSVDSCANVAAANNNVSLVCVRCKQKQAKENLIRADMPPVPSRGGDVDLRDTSTVLYCMLCVMRGSSTEYCSGSADCKHDSAVSQPHMFSRWHLS